MSGYYLHKYPDPILREICAPIESMEPGQYDDLIKEMFTIMYANDGVGLAAPQIGEAIRIITVGLPNCKMALINPQIVYRKGHDIRVEGCLSYPGRKVRIQRATLIHVAALNPDGEPQELTATDMVARVIQHEVDHLDGLCRVGPNV